MADFRVEPADWALDFDALHSLRKAVFIEEQGVPEDQEWDATDPDCEHVLALAGDDTPIGCGRLTPERKIGRMAVTPDWRGHGVGAALLGLLIERARARGWPEVRCHAQTSALAFYAKHGFEPVGERFMEAGIEHQRMRRAIEALVAPPTERGRRPPTPDAQRLQCERFQDMQTLTLGLLQQSRHKVRIHSAALEPLLPDDDPAIDELRRLATSGRHAEVRVLVHDPDSLLRDGHRLIGLAQRLETAIDIRTVVERDDLQYPSAFLVNDVGGYLLQPQRHRPRAVGCSHAPGRNRNLATYFDEVWHRSQTATALRKLDL